MTSGHSNHWATIEAEHAALVEMLDQARLVAARSNLSARAVIPVYEAIVKRFEEHFASEERLMQMTRYPEAETHGCHHQVLLIRLLSICERMKATQSVEIEQLELTFQSLLDDAIGADVHLRDYLARLG